MTSSHPTPAPCQWFSWLPAALDRRSAPPLASLFPGAVPARGRRTVTSWIRAAQLSGRYQSCYLAVAAAGKKADSIARRLLTEVVRPLLKGATRLTLALDDTPTKRYGPHVQDPASITTRLPGRPAPRSGRSTRTGSAIRTRSHSSWCSRVAVGEPHPERDTLLTPGILEGGIARRPSTS